MSEILAPLASRHRIACFLLLMHAGPAPSFAQGVWSNRFWSAVNPAEWIAHWSPYHESVWEKERAARDRYLASEAAELDPDLRWHRRRRAAPARDNSEGEPPGRPAGASDAGRPRESPRSLPARRARGTQPGGNPAPPRHSLADAEAAIRAAHRRQVSDVAYWLRGTRPPGNAVSFHGAISRDLARPLGEEPVYLFDPEFPDRPAFLTDEILMEMNLDPRRVYRAGELRDLGARLDATHEALPVPARDPAHPVPLAPEHQLELPPVELPALPAEEPGVPGPPATAPGSSRDPGEASARDGIPSGDVFM